MTRMAPNYDQHPFVALDERADECVAGWEAVVGVLADAIRAGRRRVVIECYCGVFEEEVTAAVARGLPGARVLRSADAFRNRDEIARLVALGLSNNEIANRLYISPNTVKTLLKRIFEKLGIGTRGMLKQYIDASE